MVELVLDVTIPGEPMSKGRPRFTRGGGVYTPPATRQAEQHVAAHARAAMAGRPPVARGEVAVMIRFSSTSRRRKDADNLEKLTLDACNKIVWADDSLITSIQVAVDRGASTSCTRLVVWAITDEEAVA